MVSRYKYFPVLLGQYNNKVHQPAVKYDNPLIEFHYSRPEPSYYVQNFELDPFDQTQPDFYDDSYKSLVVEPVEEQEIVTRGFRSVEIDESRKLAPQNRMNLFPYLFVPHDKWWEYEGFRKFPDYDVWYSLKFKEWHKHMIMNTFETVAYDPMWCVDPKDQYYDFYMYYYSTTLKYYKPWRFQIPTYVCYTTNRKFIYTILLLGIYMYYQIVHIKTRTRMIYVVMGQDFWIKDYSEFRKAFNENSPYSIAGDIALLETLCLGLPKIFAYFRYGPVCLEDFYNSVEKSRKMSQKDYYDMIKK
jgi:hypothetical protein